MNWPLDKDWKCEICGSRSLTWGLYHAKCRCDKCHTNYYMRNDDSEQTVRTIPKCLIKKEFYEPAKKWWDETHKPITEADIEDWIRFGVPSQEFQEK